MKIYHPFLYYFCGFSVNSNLSNKIYTFTKTLTFTYVNAWFASASFIVDQSTYPLNSNSIALAQFSHNSYSTADVGFPLTVGINTSESRVSLVLCSKNGEIPTSYSKDLTLYIVIFN